MSWQGEVETMSSSKILKSNVLVEGMLPTEFNFLTLNQLVENKPKGTEPGAFVPSALAPQAEKHDGFIAIAFGDETANIPESQEIELEEEQPPPGIMITEEELESKLRESYESGLGDGKSLAERGLLHVFNSLRTATEDLHALREKVLRESEDEMLKLIMMIARKIILREARTDTAILKNVIKAALTSVSERDEIIVHLNPDDYSMVTSRTDFFPSELMTERMRLKPDPTLHQGSCNVNTEMGIIDADFDSQLEEIYRHLLEERSSSTMEMATV